MPYPTPQDAFARTVRYFRAFGFFEDYGGQSEEQLTSELGALFATQFGDEFDATNPFSDLLLLSLDRKRTWWDDTEADVCAANQVYKQTLEEWSLISRGAFLIKNVQEIWNGEQGPVQVTFEYQRRSIRLEPVYMDDWMDLRIVSSINWLIRDSGMQFEMPSTGDQTALVLPLTPIEKERFRSERGWQFEA
jgi:hypothetical protein